MRITTFGAAVVAVGLAMSGAAYAQQAGAGGQQGAFCLQGTSGAKNCSFATMAACTAAKTGQSDQCQANANRTSGSGASGTTTGSPAAAPPAAAQGGRPSSDARPAGSNPPAGGGSPSNK